MIVVVASRADRAAEALRGAWAAIGAVRLTPADLSAPGWAFDPHAVGDGVAVIEGERLPVRAITGVLTRLPWILPVELDHIRAADRDYAAAEMNAFLLAWLSALGCPMLNRPTAGCLAGPALHTVEWADAAARAGVPTSRGPERATVAVVGGRCVGDVHPVQSARARRLAEEVDAGLLRVGFSSPGDDGRVVSADPWPDVADPTVASAILAALAEAGA